MNIELAPPVEHDAQHDVDLCIQGLPTHAIFCSSMFVALKLTDAQVRQLREELDEWLRSPK